jgi:hypothetical protein
MKTYWESLLKISDNPCQSSGLIAYANYTDGTDGHLYTKDGKIEGVSLNGANKPSGSYNLAGLLTGNWSIEITAKMPSETS